MDRSPSAPRFRRKRAPWAPPVPPIAAIFVGVVLGAVLGVITQFLQGELSANWGTVFANSGIAWSLSAFGIGALMSSERWAALAGALSLVVAAFVYYEAVGWFEHFESDGGGAVMWSVAGLIVGPPFGLAGHWARFRPDRRFLAWALVAGVLMAEGAHLIWFVGVDNLWPAGLAELVAGVAIAALSLRSDPRRLLIVTIVVVAAAATRLAHESVARWL